MGEKTTSASWKNFFFSVWSNYIRLLAYQFMISAADVLTHERKTKLTYFWSLRRGVKGQLFNRVGCILGKRNAEEVRQYITSGTKS